MIVYFAVFFMVSTFSFLDSTKFTNHPFPKYILFLVLLLFVGFRDGIGVDTQRYYDFFIENNGYFEKGYIWFMDFIRLIYDDHYFFMFIFSFFLIHLKLLGFRKTTPKPYVALLFYTGYFLLYSDMNTIRQAMSFGIVLFSLPYLRERKLLPFFMVVFIASLMHYSALIFCICYWFYNFRMSVVGFFILFVCVVFLVYILDFKAILNSVINNIMSSYAYRISLYISSEAFGRSGIKWNRIFLWLLNLCPFLYFKNKIKNNFYNGILNILILGFLADTVLTSMSLAFSRLGDYFFFLGAILYAYIFDYQKKIYHKILLISFLLLACMFKFSRIASVPSHYKSYVPYKNILFL